MDENIKEMINKWSKQNLIKQLEFVKKGENIFRDQRGEISNHELTEPINLIGLINSKKVQFEQTTITLNKNKNVCSPKVELLRSSKT